MCRPFYFIAKYNATRTVPIINPLSLFIYFQVIPRKVALTWIESHIPQASQREISFDLDCARKEIMEHHGKTAAFDRITKTHANLLRQWAMT
jgi:hypothetical protein